MTFEPDIDPGAFPDPDGQIPPAQPGQAVAGTDPGPWHLALWARTVSWIHGPGERPAAAGVPGHSAEALGDYLRQLGYDDLAQTVTVATDATVGPIGPDRAGPLGAVDLALVVTRALVLLGGRARHEGGICHVESWPSALALPPPTPERLVFEPGSTAALAQDDPLVRRLAAAVLEHFPTVLDDGAVLLDPAGGEDRFHLVVAVAVEEVGPRGAAVLDRRAFHVEAGASGARAVAPGRLSSYLWEGSSLTRDEDSRLARQQAATLVSTDLGPQYLQDMRRWRRDWGIGVLELEGDDPAALVEGWERACPLRLPPPVILAVARVRAVGALASAPASTPRLEGHDGLGWTRILELSVSPTEEPVSTGGAGRILHLESMTTDAAGPAQPAEGVGADAPAPPLFSSLSGPSPEDPAALPPARRGARRRHDPGTEWDLRTLWEAHHERLVRLGAKPREGVDLVVRNHVDGALALWIPPGTFTMGADDGSLDERPVHEVLTDGFYMDLHPVTRQMFAEFVRQAGHPRPGLEGESGVDDGPVVQVSWHDAQAYCEWSGKRLPTEAEWEKAARGTDGRRYPWGNRFEVDRVILAAAGRRGPAPVLAATTGASPFGVLGTAGNVWEWVGDWYDPAYYSRGDWTNPAGAAHGARRVLRGGSWICHPRLLRTTARHSQPPSRRSPFVSFRCAG